MKKKLTLLLFTLAFLAIVSCETKEQQKEPLTQADNTTYLEKGQHIASSTFAALSGKLQAAMKEGGMTNAVEYCNLAAFPLVDSLSKVHQATIRRTASKLRNPENAPSPAEQSILEAYQKMVQDGEQMKPLIREINDQTVAFYAPIQINAFCLQCHGKTGETLQEEDHAVIQKLYPNDKATGYAEGDLRGIWSIQFHKDSNH